MTLRRWLASLVNRLRGRRLDAELDTEIQVHLEMAVDEYVARGMPRPAAALAARRQFGVVASVKETYRQTDSLYWIDTLIQDVRFGLRTLRRSPGFAGATLLTLALGIGMTATVFSVVDNLLINGVPFADADRPRSTPPQHLDGRPTATGYLVRPGRRAGRGGSACVRHQRPC